VSLPPWEPANNGSGKMMWFVQRQGADRGDWPGGSDKWYYRDSNGRLVRFATCEAAYKVAAGMNAAAEREG
jgi:glucan-binding YG repeat protein